LDQQLHHTEHQDPLLEDGLLEVVLEQLVQEEEQEEQEVVHLQEIMEQLILVEVDQGIILVVEDLVLWLYDINLNNYGTFCKNRGR
jgi:hypothetical protein